MAPRSGHGVGRPAAQRSGRTSWSAAVCARFPPAVGWYGPAAGRSRRAPRRGRRPWRALRIPVATSLLPRRGGLGATRRAAQSRRRRGVAPAQRSRPWRGGELAQGRAPSPASSATAVHLEQERKGVAAFPSPAPCLAGLLLPPSAPVDGLRRDPHRGRELIAPPVGRLLHVRRRRASSSTRGGGGGGEAGWHGDRRGADPPCAATPATSAPPRPRRPRRPPPTSLHRRSSLSSLSEHASGSAQLAGPTRTGVEGMFLSPQRWSCGGSPPRWRCRWSCGVHSFSTLWTTPNV